MEYVDGEDLASLLRRVGRFPMDRGLAIAGQLTAGLAAAHAQGVLHRDLKPANVMVDGRGRVRLTAFGLAGVAGTFEAHDLTSGTPAYMAPEQFEGRGVTARTDLYALGLVLYEVFEPINVRMSMEELEGGKMRRSSRFGATLALSLAALTAPVRAQEPVPLAGGPASGASADIEPEALAAFKRMGAYLRTLKAFQVRAVITERATAPVGAPRPYVTGFVDLLAQTPSRLRVVQTGGRLPGVYVCDGKLCTAWRPNGNYYATTPAPPTIWDVTANPGKYVGFGFFALNELFYWADGKTPWSGAVIKAATDLGPSSVEGTDCEHYRYRGWTATGWEICIQNGGHPLPRKLVVRSLSEDVDESTTIYTWNLAPSFDAAAFTFDPPPNAHRSNMR